jgi:integrase
MDTLMLTTKRIREAEPALKLYRLADAHGLCLEVKTNGAKLWRYRYRVIGAQRMLSLGVWPDVSLAQARAALVAVRAAVGDGRDPVQQRRRKRLQLALDAANTLHAVAAEWFKQNVPHWSASYAGQVRGLLDRDLRSLSALPVREVTPAAVLEVLRAIERRGAPTLALLARQVLGAVVRFAIGTGRADVDPTASLRGVIRRPPVAHRLALSAEQLAGLLQAAHSYRGSRMTAISVELLALLFVRPAELSRALWIEVDFMRAVWNIPAERMKRRKPHTVPLAAPVIVLLQELRALAGDSEWLFPNQHGASGSMPPTSLNAALIRLGFSGSSLPGFSAHGFRATAATRLAEMGFSPDLIERQLAHAERSAVRRAYQHAELLPERRAMMEAWAAYLGGLSETAKDSKRRA